MAASEAAGHVREVSDTDVPDVHVRAAVSAHARGASCCSRFRSVVTVEPVIFLYFLGFISYIPTLQQYVYQVIGDQHGLSHNTTTNCTPQHNHSDPIENDVQSESSIFMLIVNAVTLLPGLIMTMFLGNYSDHKGRRIALILPILGGVARALISLLVVVYKLNLYYLLGAAVLDSCSGSVMAMLMSSFAYVSDITTHKNRSMRILFVELSIMVGVATATIATGYIIRLWGFAYSFLFGVAVHSINAILATLYIRETVTSDEPVSFISFTHIKETVFLFTRDDETKRRWKLVVTLLMTVITCTVDIGSSDVTTFYLLDHPLCFTSVMIGYYSAVTYLLKAVWSIILLKLLFSLLGDTGLIILGCVAGVAAQTLLGLSHTRFMIFTVPLVNASEAIVLALLRSLSSKLVQPQELGALFSAISFGQQASTVIGGLVFNSIYSRTVYHFVGTPFLVAAGFFVVALCLAIWLHVGIRRQSKQDSGVAYGPIN